MAEEKFTPLIRFGELATVYIPIEVYTRRFDPHEGLKRGTIFPELYMPYRAAS
ncbi:MAG: spore coat associated protein CotJA [Bacillota bacterium]